MSGEEDLSMAVLVSISRGQENFSFNNKIKGKIENLGLHGGGS